MNASLALIRCGVLPLLLTVLASLPVPLAAREVTACGHHDYPPWNWLRANEIVGTCADVARTAFEQLGHKLNLKYVGPWMRCQALIEAGMVDVNICAFRSPERETYSRFVEVPMGVNPIAVFVKKGREFPFRQWSDLAGKRSGVVVGVSMGPEFDAFLTTQTRLERVSEPILNLRKLDAERLDFLPLGREAGMLQIQLYGFDDRIAPLPHPVLDGDLYISISNKSADLHGQIPELERFLSRPAYKQELAKSLGRYREQYVHERLKK